MNYARIENNQVVNYPVTFSEIRNEHPNFNMTQATNPPGDFVLVKYTPRPKLSNTQKAVQATPELVNGEWRQVWEVQEVGPGELSPAEQKAINSIKRKRDSLLSRSDWTQVPDAPTDKEAWATYRQALRDVPEQEGYPWEVTWPEPPFPLQGLGILGLM